MSSSVLWPPEAEAFKSRFPASDMHAGPTFPAWWGCCIHWAMRNMWGLDPGEGELVDLPDLIMQTLHDQVQKGCLWKAQHELT